MFANKGKNGLLMFFKTLPTFLFNEENLFCHAHNIKSILENLSFKECHLGHLQCSQIIATAFNASSLTTLLMEDLKNTKLSELPISEKAIPAIAEKILKFAKPLPFEGLNPDDYDDDDHTLRFLNYDKEPKIQKSLLINVQKDWKDWHIKTAEFIYAYLKETHGRFAYLDKLKLTAHPTRFFEHIILKNITKPIAQENLFLHACIYNQLFLYPQPYDKRYTDKQKSENYEYYLSPELIDYLQKNEEALPHLYKNRINKKQGLVLSYDSQRQAATLNILMAWKFFYKEEYPKFIKTEFIEDPKNLYILNTKLRTLKAPSFIWDFKEKYPLNIRVINKYAELPERMNELLKNQDIEFTEQDYQKCLEPSSHALWKFGVDSKLTEIPCAYHNDPEYLNWCEENAMSMLDTITIPYIFEKPLNLYVDIEDKKWQIYAELTITCTTKGELLFTANDDKLNVSYRNLNTKIARNKKYHDYLVLRTYLKCEDANEKPRLLTENKNLKVSHLKTKGFKEMYLNYPLLGPFKNFLHKNWRFEIAAQHQSLMNFYNISGIKAPKI